MNKKHFLIAYEEKWGKGDNYYCSTVVDAIDQYTAIKNFWQNKPKSASWHILAISEIPENCLELPICIPREQ